MTVYLPYRYRDGDNYKQAGTIELTARLTDEQAVQISESLDQYEYFIPEQVGVTALPYSKGGTDADHPWHEFSAVESLDIEGVAYYDFAEDYNSGPFTPEELVAAFVKAKADGWNDTTPADAATALVAQIAGYLTTDEVGDDDNDITAVRDILDDLIREARKIQG